MLLVCTDRDEIRIHLGGKLRELYRDLQVLRVSDNGRTVTLRATQPQAGKLIHAMTNGRLVLRR